MQPQPSPSVVPGVMSAVLLTLCCAASGSDALMEEHGVIDDNPLMAEGRLGDMDRNIDDLRIGGGVIQRLAVSERVSTVAGTHADYRWGGLNEYGTTFGISAIGAAHRFAHQGSLLLGVGATMQLFDITPHSYEVGGAIFPNGRRDLDLQYQTVSLDLMIGYGTRPWVTRFGDWHLEALAVGSGGIAWADTQGFTSTGSAVRCRGVGWQYAYGPRLGLYITEQSWIFGVHGDWLFSHGEVRIKQPNGDTSVVTAAGDGIFAGEAEIGYRF